MSSSLIVCIRLYVIVPESKLVNSEIIRLLAFHLALMLLGKVVGLFGAL